jgi:hypothetical protein
MKHQVGGERVVPTTAQMLLESHRDVEVARDR